MTLSKSTTFLASLLSLASLAAPINAQSTTQGSASSGPNTAPQNGTFIVPSTSSSFNQQGFNLPSMPRSSGQDIVRGAGGISCQSSVGSNGPVFDMGVIGTNDIYSRDSAALYGRITVPLGKKPKRIDCSRLYDLEVQRLKLEIQMMRAGAGAAAMFGQNSDVMRAQFEQVHQADTQAQTISAAPITISAPIPITQSAAVKAQVLIPEKITPVETSEKVSNLKRAPHKTSGFAHIPPIFKQPDAQTKLTSSALKPAPKAATIKTADLKTIPAVYVETISRPKRITASTRLNVSGQPDYQADFYVQLGAFSTEANARRALATYSANFPANLNGYEAVARPIERRETTLYLLQVGPFIKSEAASLCAAVGNDCYPTRRREP